MFTLLDPMTADLIFTISASLGLIVAAAATIAALPWTTAEIQATERSFVSLLSTAEVAPSRVRVTR